MNSSLRKLYNRNTIKNTVKIQSWPLDPGGRSWSPFKPNYENRSAVPYSELVLIAQLFKRIFFLSFPSLKII